MGEMQRVVVMSAMSMDRFGIEREEVHRRNAVEHYALGRDVHMAGQRLLKFES